MGPGATMAGTMILDAIATENINYWLSDFK